MLKTEVRANPCQTIEEVSNTLVTLVDYPKTFTADFKIKKVDFLIPLICPKRRKMGPI